MGNGKSKLESQLEEEGVDRRFLGLSNLGNTCYCNSMLQALYSCEPFRDAVLEWYAKQPKDRGEDLLLCLGELFATIAKHPKRIGKVTPTKFVERVRQENELFSQRAVHQDAHEFLNFLLNECFDIVEKDRKQSGSESNFVRELFEGKLETRTQCLWCESVTTREEAFFDLSLDVPRNCSLTACLRKFSDVELLSGREKFHCDHCCGLQEAQKRMLVKEAPRILALHLKRFKYVEHLGKYKKVTQRVAFPHELKLCNVTESSPARDVPYDLFAIVVHKGSTPNHGHYISLVRCHSRWVRFDDDEIDLEDDSAPESFFGSSSAISFSSCDNGYILFYAQRPSSRPPEHDFGPSAKSNASSCNGVR